MTQRLPAKFKFLELSDIKGKLFYCTKRIMLMDYWDVTNPISNSKTTDVYVEPGELVMCTGRCLIFFECIEQPVKEYEVLFGETVGWAIRTHLRSAKSWKDTKVVQESEDTWHGKPDYSNPNSNPRRR